MHLVIIGVAFVVALVLGYAFRGWIHGELIASKSELTSFATRLENSLASDEKTVRTVVNNVLSDIRKKL
jgi:hypothetical protein